MFFFSLLPAHLLQSQGAGGNYQRHDPITPQASSNSTPDNALSTSLPTLPSAPHCEIESWLLLLKTGGCNDFELPSSGFPSVARLILCSCLRDLGDKTSLSGLSVQYCISFTDVFSLARLLSHFFDYVRTLSHALLPDLKRAPASLRKAPQPCPSINNLASFI